MMKRTDFYENFSAILLIFCTMMLSPISAKADEGVFSIKNVQVDVTADNAAKARQIAFNRAQLQAFSQLMSKMMSDMQRDNFTMPELETVSLMVKDFEIVSEKLSSVRYVGVYNFRFKDNEVRKYLGSLGVQYSDVQSRPIMLLPYYQLGTKTYLWGDTNPWFKAWQTTSSYGGLVPIIVPIGDLSDMNDIKDDQALTYDPASMNELMKRYNVQDSIVAIAVPDKFPQISELGQPLGVPLTIYIYRVDVQGPTFIRKLNIASDVTETLSTAMSKAVVMVRKEVSRDWKRQTVVNAGQQSYIEVAVPFRSIREWTETKTALENQQAVSKVSVASISASQATVRIDYRGTMERLRLALSQGNMTLDTPSLYGAYDKYTLYLNRYKPVVPATPVEIPAGNQWSTP